MRDIQIMVTVDDFDALIARLRTDGVLLPRGDKNEFVTTTGIGGDYETIIGIHGVGLYPPATLSHERFVEEAEALAAEIVARGGVIREIDYDL